MTNYTIRPIRAEEINQVADIISAGYYDDIFFHWVVEKGEDRLQVVSDYYKVYLRARGCKAHVAQADTGEIVGASVWLPDDTDAGVYDEIDQAAGPYAPNFRAVADMSHDREPDVRPFYQLVGFAVNKDLQGKGIGTALLKHCLDELDGRGIPTYLEASTPYFGKGVYGKFGYERYGELMVFSDTAVLYPCWRGAGGQ